MTASKVPRNLGDVEFTITDYVQRLELFRAAGRGETAAVGAAVHMVERYDAAILVPICGKAFQRLGTRGFDPDGFMRQTGSFKFEAHEDIRHALVRGWLPEQHAGDVRVTVSCSDVAASVTCAPATLFSIKLDVEIPRAQEREFTVTLSSSFQPSSLSQSGDTRHLGCILQYVQFD